jgi:hypothetical protein
LGFEARLRLGGASFLALLIFPYLFMDDEEVGGGEMDDKGTGGRLLTFWLRGVEVERAGWTGG